MYNLGGNAGCKGSLKTTTSRKGLEDLAERLGGKRGKWDTTGAQGVEYLKKVTPIFPRSDTSSNLQDAQ